MIAAAAAMAQSDSPFFMQNLGAGMEAYGKEIARGDAAAQEAYFGLRNLSGVNAAKGVVVAYPSGCDYYIVETNIGYALLEWFGGNDPIEGDTLVGDFESYGMKNIYNITVDRETRVWVEDYMLSESSVIEQYNDNCVLPILGM